MQSIPMALPLSRTERRSSAVIMTWYNLSHDYFQGPYTLLGIENELLSLERRCSDYLRFDPDIRDASRMWLCQALVPDEPINGTFFSDGNIYTDALLQYLRCINLRQHKWDPVLPFILSKASLSEKLAIFMMENMFQRPTHIRKSTIYRNSEEEIRNFFLALCIYLSVSFCYYFIWCGSSEHFQECGIPFHEKHKHPPGYDPFHWVCGICLLFGRFTAECPDIELSLDPAARPGYKAAQVADVEVQEPVQVNLLHQVMNGGALMWLRAWIVNVAYLLVYFFPVVA